MVRKLAWLFVALLIVADVVLITSVLRTSGPSRAARASSAAGGDAAFPAPEMVTPTRPGRAPSTAAPGAVATGLVAPMWPAAPGSTLASTPESGRIQVLGESRDEDAPPDTTAPGEPPAGQSGGGILLRIGSDGEVLRAARGACPSPVATGLAVSHDLGATWAPVPAVMAQVLAVGTSGAGAMWFVGTDPTCRPTAQESPDGGATWRPSSVRGKWYLNPDPASTDVASPRLLADVGCVPTALAGIDARRAAAVCGGGDIRVTDDSGDTWATASTVPGAVSLAFASADRGYALARTRACPAAVLRTVDGARTWTQVACLGDAAPMAIAVAGTATAAAAGEPVDAGTAAAAAAGEPADAGTATTADTVVAQAGAELHVSHDGGRSWRTTAG